MSRGSKALFFVHLPHVNIKRETFFLCQGSIHRYLCSLGRRKVMALSECKRWPTVLTNYNWGCGGRCNFDWTALFNHRLEIVFNRLCLTISEDGVVHGMNMWEAWKTWELNSTSGINVNNRETRKQNKACSSLGLFTNQTISWALGI